MLIYLDNAVDCALVKVDILCLLLLLQSLLCGLDEVVGGLSDGVGCSLQPLHAAGIGVGLHLAGQEELGCRSGDLLGSTD